MADMNQDYADLFLITLIWIPAYAGMTTAFTFLRFAQSNFLSVIPAKAGIQEWDGEK
jgi:hypothetical protein